MVGGNRAQVGRSWFVSELERAIPGAWTCEFGSLLEIDGKQYQVVAVGEGFWHVTETKVTVNRTRSLLYSLAQFLGDYQTVKNGGLASA